MYVTHTFFYFDHPTSNHYSINYNVRIEKTINDLKSQSRTNIAVTVKKWDVHRTTLTRRFQDVQDTRQDTNSYVRQKLTRTQEETLIEYVNKLNDRGFPLTPQILKNITESITRTTLDPN